MDGPGLVQVRQAACGALGTGEPFLVCGQQSCSGQTEVGLNSRIRC